MKFWFLNTEKKKLPIEKPAVFVLYNMGRTSSTCSVAFWNLPPFFYVSIVRSL